MHDRTAKPTILLGLICLLTFAAGPTAAAWERPGPVLQFGPVPCRAPSGGWAIAAPVGPDSRTYSLESSDDQLSLFVGPGDEVWLAVEPLRPGPITALLRTSGEDGSEDHVTVAAEGVGRPAAGSGTILMVSPRGGTPLRRLVRAPAPILALQTGGLEIPVSGPEAGGWQLLEIVSPAGGTERRDRLVLADGTTIDLQISLQESITTLAATSLPVGWTYERVIALDEDLLRRDLRASLAVVGVRSGERLLRRFHLARDRQTREYTFSLAGRVGLPAIDPAAPHRLLLARAGIHESEVPVRRRFMLRLSRESAVLLDPRTGAVAERSVRGLRFTGAATASELHRDWLYSIRLDPRTGNRFLRRWMVDRSSGRPALRGRLFSKPLHEALAVRGVRAHDLVPWLQVRRGLETPARESLLVLATGLRAAKADPPATVFELVPRRDGSGRFASARRQYVSMLAPPPDGTRARMRWLKTPTVGAAGFPMRLQMTFPGIRAGEIVGLEGVGARFRGRALVPARSHGLDCSGYSLDPVFYLHSRYDGESTSLRRRVLGPEGLVTMARGGIRAGRMVDLRASSRGRHSYALTNDGVGGEESVHTLRMFTNGIPEGINLPPRVDAGPDLTLVARSGNTATVRLRARLADANGDPLSVRWFGPGVRFSAPDSPVTEAEFPLGTTQVRALVRDGALKDSAYEASDIIEVSVTAASGVGQIPSLATGLRGIFPNPANPRLSVAFSVARRDRIVIRVYDLAGRLVRTLLDEERPAGAYDIPWDGTEEQGRSVASGVYPIRLESSTAVQTDRAVIVR